METANQAVYKASTQLNIDGRQWRIEVSASTLDELHAKIEEVIKDHEKRKKSSTWTRGSAQ